MRNYIELNNQSSEDINGLLIQSLPPISKPLMRSTIEEIDGRDGDIVTNLGYSAYSKTVSVGLYGGFEVDEIIEFFNSEGTVIFSNEPDKVYNYQILDQIDFERLVRYRTANVTFHVQPFKYSTEELPLTFNNSQITGEGSSFTMSVATPVSLNSVIVKGNSSQASTPTTSFHVAVKTVTGDNTVTLSGGGSQQQTYSLTLGTVQLAQISAASVQDYIYQSAGVWTIHQEVGVMEINPSDITITSNYTNVVYAKVPKPTDDKGYGSYQGIPVLSNVAEYAFGPSNWDTTTMIGKICGQADANTYWIGFPAGTTLAQVKSALADAEIYYPLATATDTALSSNTLSDELDDLLGATLYQGKTTISNSGDGAPAILSITTSTSNSYTVKNNGNVVSRPVMTITGTGTVNLSLNGTQLFVLYLTDAGTEEITIDTAAMEAYQGSLDTLMNRYVDGDYDNFKLNVGQNTISWTGDLTSLSINNYSRWL